MTIKSEFTTTLLAIICGIVILFSIPIESSAVTYDDDTSLDFIWEAASGDVDHYNVYVSIDEGDYVLVGNTSETSYTVEGSDGHSYKVQVEAADAAGNVGPMSPESDPVICNLIKPGDVSRDGQITAFDASLVLQYVVKLTELSQEQKNNADVTDNGTVTALDAALILQYTVGLITQFPVQTKTAAPIIATQSEEDKLMKTIAQLESTTLNGEQKRVLEQLKRLVFKEPIPKHTAPLQNFPNPFNPETWLPYQLAQDALVTIHIYNAKGQLIRTIALGNKNAGFYITKSKAAYWDGRSIYGEKVASGVYYYTLQVGEAIPRIGAGEFKATRKMVIMK